MSKIFAYYAVHYGVEYAREAVASIAPLCDEIAVFYTPIPTFGYSTISTCPESRQAILDEVMEGCRGTMLNWYDMPVGKFAHEGEHRDYCVQWCESCGADIVLAPDLDEVYDMDCLAEDIDHAAGGVSCRWLMRVQGHFWRGMNHVCRDASMPVRIIKRGGNATPGYLPSKGFWHFGYAQSIALTAYKMKIHGHKSDIRPGWYPMFRDWTPESPLWPGGVHPTNDKNFWVPEPFDRSKIDYLVGEHPYYDEGLV